MQTSMDDDAFFTSLCFFLCQQIQNGLLLSFNIYHNCILFKKREWLYSWFVSKTKHISLCDLIMNTSKG